MNLNSSIPILIFLNGEPADSEGKHEPTSDIG
jgi:hypothetical protein